jgi:hypothetical protein
LRRENLLLFLERIKEFCDNQILVVVKFNKIVSSNVITETSAPVAAAM